jgi:hypothetical protein
MAFFPTRVIHSYNVLLPIADVSDGSKADLGGMSASGAKRTLKLLLNFAVSKKRTNLSCLGTNVLGRLL